MQETPRKGSDTKERILDVAEAGVLEKGFAATSIEELIAAVDITKSGFFYHFKDKNELAKALLIRYVEREDFRKRLELIAARYPPKGSVDLGDLADMLSVIADGGIILSRVVNDKQALPRQIMLYRDFIRAVFLGSL